MGNVRVRQTVNINSGGSGGGLEGLLPLAAVVVGAYIGLSVLAAVIHALTIILIWLLVVFGVAIVAAGVVVWVFRDRIRATMVRRGDPRNELDDIKREKRVELARIRAMRLQLEAARIAGVEITDEMLRVAEDPGLYDMILRFQTADRLLRHQRPLEPGPRGHSDT